MLADDVKIDGWEVNDTNFPSKTHTWTDENAWVSSTSTDSGTTFTYYSGNSSYAITNSGKAIGASLSITSAKQFDVTVSTAISGTASNYFTVTSEGGSNFVAVTNELISALGETSATLTLSGSRYKWAKPTTADPVFSSSDGTTYTDLGEGTYQVGESMSEQRDKGNGWFNGSWLYTHFSQINAKLKFLVENNKARIISSDPDFTA